MALKTYQDWLKVADKSEEERMAFIKAFINSYKTSERYLMAITGEAYYAGQNTTIKQYEKMLFNALGQMVKDNVSANHKLASRFFYRMVSQSNSVLLGNGLTWKGTAGEKALGTDFDTKIVAAGEIAQTQGVAYGFYNNKSVVIFPATEFAPLVDEEDGAIKAGVRFWQIDSSKPLRATMYEMDGYTEYMFTKDHPEGEIRNAKRPYVLVKKVSAVDGEEIYDGYNYPSFPIVPLYSNRLKQSELIPIRPTLDAYDLINSGYANDQDDANIIYWTITNAGGMNDTDLVTFLDKLRKMHAANLDDDQQVEAHQTEPPYAGREAILERLEKQLYKDSMMLDTYYLASGAVTATQIRAAYEPLNEKLDIYETHITTFIQSLLAIAQVTDECTFSRSYVVNASEEIDNVMKAANYLPEPYVTEKVLTLLGDKDQMEKVEAMMADIDISRFTGGNITPEY